MTTRRLDGTERGWGAAVVGLVAAFVGGLFLAQAGGSDRETFLSLGYLFGACGPVSYTHLTLPTICSV